ncbi:stage V sporulation protein AB [Metabacillus sp. GX 13764]|uniref:stage V sporulation protein AB n=1 Tax=Metabacillus kandeliae TaxID=2900151 RepID=UPI001E2FA465|nr:stage V sporulation protein AB [Metabacillus kandeliae]MCD7033295.1 stage V sporulation protein AB [Metabacillus kandeliae]
MISSLLIIFIGFAGGLAVGSGFVAFLSVLGIIPRLTQLSKTGDYIRAYEWGVAIGAVAGGWLSLANPMLYLPAFITAPVGLFDGVFIGLLAAALTEVLNVLPILAKRIGIQDKMIIILMAIVMGKVTGSLFHWLYFIHH